MPVFVETVRIILLAAFIAFGIASVIVPDAGPAAETEATVATVGLAAPAAGGDKERVAFPKLALSTDPVDDVRARKPAVSEPFGLFLTRSSSPPDLSMKWRELQARITAEEKELAQCRSAAGACPTAATEFLRIVELGRQSQGRARIGTINRAINLKIKPMSDLIQHGALDVWSAPLATFAAGAGDCEDYAIAKYVALRESGYLSEDLRLVIVRDIKRHSDHAVVAVRFDGEWLLMDNRHLILVNADEARHYHPLFMLDSRGIREFRVAKISD